MPDNQHASQSPPITSLLDDIEKKLLKKSWDGYYNFARQIVTLSAGALTLTISLQKFYIPQHPLGLWLLQLAWVSWILSLLFGFLVLYGEVQIPLDNLNQLRKARDKNGDLETGVSLLEFPFFEVRSLYRKSYFLMVSCFLLAIFSITIFSILNVFKI